MIGESPALTPEQETLASLREGAYLIVAPPGSGKTEVLSQRIVRLVQASTGANFKILALSFTKAAANTMRRRIGERLGENTWRVLCSTYHGFCGDLLRSYGQLINLPADFTIYDTTEDRLQALAVGLDRGGFLSDRTGLDRSQTVKVLDSIGRLKRDLVPAAAAPDESLSGFPLSLRDAYTAYELALNLSGAIDFDGLITRSCELLAAHPEVAQQYRDSYRYILIDEAQDTSRAQYEFLKILCGSTHRNVLMVADPAQSIYAFTGASSRFVSDFERDFGAKRYSLNVTFRCSGSVLRVARTLLATGSQGASEESIRAIAPGLVVFREFESEHAEAVGAIDWITECTLHGLPSESVAPEEETSVGPEQTAIMARSRNHLREVLRELDSRDIAYHFVTGDAGLFDTEEYQIILYALKLVANRHDVALSRSLLASIQNSRFSSVLSDYGSSVEDSERLLSALASDASATVLGEPLGALADSFKTDVRFSTVVDRLVAWNPATRSEDSDEKELLTGDREILNDRWVLFRNRPNAQQSGWHGLVLELVSTPRPESAGVRVLTVHASKGLEFKAVAVVGLNEGSFPDFRNTDNEGIESEQRLMYVAVTRASRALWLSRARVRRTAYGSRWSEPSRFIALMGVAGEL
jgi:DNA helicase II / ATP-dependent DNA helicase PcrA